MPGRPTIEDSMGKVMRCSISRGERPVILVFTCTWTLVISGTASMGRREKFNSPSAAMPTVRKTTNRGQSQSVQFMRDGPEFDFGVSKLTPGGQIFEPRQDAFGFQFFGAGERRLCQRESLLRGKISGFGFGELPAFNDGKYVPGLYLVAQVFVHSLHDASGAGHDVHHGVRVERQFAREIQGSFQLAAGR